MKVECKEQGNEYSLPFVTTTLIINEIEFQEVKESNFISLF